MFDAPPERPAVIMAGSGESITHGELEARSCRLAQLFHARGLRPGDHLAVMLENHPRYFEVFWAAQRAGLYITPINQHLKADEAGYIVQDCGASVLVTSASLSEVAAAMTPYLDGVSIRLAVDGPVDGYESYEDAVSGHSATPLDDEVQGAWMFYSSGTTGRPKGILTPMPGTAFGAEPPRLALLLQMLGFSSETVYLCPAPLYHAAPLGWSTTVQFLGGTTVLMERFDAASALAAIDRHRVTHAQLVPTHFVRMLKLAPAERERHDLSSLQLAVHAAAPCPIEVKRRMLEWWGPILTEYYAGSEGNGMCMIGSQEWLEHPGSVGRPVAGIVHVLDDEGNEMPPGQPGQIWFESDVVFEYHNDPEKTRSAFNDRGWSSLGDVGHVDDDGYVYLTDRVSNMIISGGVNIYPQEVEDLLTMHPAVDDVAVIGVPDADMGEAVKAVVVPAGAVADGLADELVAYCRERLATYKCPRSVDFVDSLPRLPTGKLLKRELRSRYWSDAS